MHVNSSRLWQLAKEFMCGCLVRERVHVKLKQAEKKRKHVAQPQQRYEQILAPPTFMAVYNKVEDEPHKLSFAYPRAIARCYSAKEHSTQRLM